MLFEDPIQTVRVELPPGWTYNPFDSTLTDFYFIRWDRTEDVVAVHVRPASIAHEEPDEAWIAKIRSEVGDKASLAEMVGIGKCAILAELPSGKGEQRVIFIRGPQVEVVIEQLCMSPESSDRWAPLEVAAQTAFSAVNKDAPQKCGADEFNLHVEAANKAFEMNEFSAMADSLQKALAAGTSAWLYSLLPRVSSPDVHAAVGAARAMMHLAGLSGNPSLQRDCECVLRRALRTLESVGPTSHSTQELMTELSQALDGMMSEILEGTEEKTGGTPSPILAMRERGFRFAHAASQALEAGDFENAHNLSGLALDDLLALMAFLRRLTPQEVPEEIASHLAGRGITDSVAQIEAMQKAREAVLFPGLILSLQIRYCCALELGDTGVVEATDVLLPFAELLCRENPRDPSITMNLALAMMDYAGARALQVADGSIDEAEKCLGTAALVLEPVQALRRSEDGWIRWHGQQFESTLRALDRRLVEAGERGDSELTKKLKTFRSQFESLAGQFRQKAGIIAESKPDTPQ